MISMRFSREVQITDHPRERMVERFIDDTRLLDLIETGETKYKDDVRLWIFKSYEDRDDNLICGSCRGVGVGHQNDHASLRDHMRQA